MATGAVSMRLRKILDLIHFTTHTPILYSILNRFPRKWLSPLRESIVRDIHARTYIAAFFRLGCTRAYARCNFSLQLCKKKLSFKNPVELQWCMDIEYMQSGCSHFRNQHICNLSRKFIGLMYICYQNSCALGRAFCINFAFRKAHSGEQNWSFIKQLVYFTLEKLLMPQRISFSFAVPSKHLSPERLDSKL